MTGPFSRYKNGEREREKKRRRERKKKRGGEGETKERRDSQHFSVDLLAEWVN